MVILKIKRAYSVLKYTVGFFILQMSKLHPLRRKRLEEGKTQYALSFESGVPQPYISLAEKGYPILKEKHRRSIAAVLGVRPEEIFPEAK